MYGYYQHNFGMKSVTKELCIIEITIWTFYFQGVSSNENGLYTCVCKHISDNSFYSETVELIVKKDWEEVYETDPFVSSKYN